MYLPCIIKECLFVGLHLKVKHSVVLNTSVNSTGHDKPLAPPVDKNVKQQQYI